MAGREVGRYLLEGRALVRVVVVSAAAAHGPSRFLPLPETKNQKYEIKQQRRVLPRAF